MSEDEYILGSVKDEESVGELKKLIDNMESLYSYRSLRIDSAKTILNIKESENESYGSRNYTYAAKGIKSGFDRRVCTICNESLFRSTFGAYIKTLVFQEISTSTQVPFESQRQTKAVLTSKHGLVHAYCAKAKARKRT